LRDKCESPHNKASEEQVPQQRRLIGSEKWNNSWVLVIAGCLPGCVGLLQSDLTISAEVFQTYGLARLVLKVTARSWTYVPKPGSFHETVHRQCITHHHVQVRRQSVLPISITTTTTSWRFVLL
jgi:hypothetical protein